SIDCLQRLHYTVSAGAEGVVDTAVGVKTRNYSGRTRSPTRHYDLPIGLKDNIRSFLGSDTEVEENFAVVTEILIQLTVWVEPRNGPGVFCYTYGHDFQVRLNRDGSRPSNCLVGCTHFRPDRAAVPEGGVKTAVRIQSNKHERVVEEDFTAYEDLSIGENGDVIDAALFGKVNDDE